MARAKKEAALTPEERLQAALVPDWEWPYKLPEDWCWTRLGNITTVVGGGTPSTSVDEYYENGIIPWISPADLSGYGDMYISRGAKNITKLGLEKSSARLMPAGTVCLSSRAPIGYVAIAKNEICTNQGFKSMLPSPCYIPEYLYWYLKGNKELLESYASGTTFLEISGGKVAQVEIPLPPLVEQQRIVDRIESLFAKLDETKEKAQAVMDGFETRKAAILHKAFTGELTANWREAHGVDFITWSNIPLGLLTDVVSSKRIYKDEYVETGIPFFRSSEVVDLYDTGFTRPEYHISVERYNQIKAQYGVPKVGDLLVTSVGTIGKTWIVDEREFYYKDGNLTQVKQCDALNMRFLQLYIMSAGFTQQVNDTVAGSAYNALTIIKFKQILIPTPSIREQMEIARVLDEILKKEQQAKEAAEAVLDQIDLMKKSILARAFRGELGTNNPTDEPAVELLKKVLDIPAESKPKAKRKFIPKELDAQIKTDLERKIIKAFIQNETDVLPIKQLMGVSSKKFDVMEALRNLQNRSILIKENDTYKLMG